MQKNEMRYLIQFASQSTSLFLQPVQNHVPKTLAIVDTGIGGLGTYFCAIKARGQFPVMCFSDNGHKPCGKVPEDQHVEGIIPHGINGIQQTGLQDIGRLSKVKHLIAGLPAAIQLNSSRIVIAPSE